MAEASYSAGVSQLTPQVIAADYTLQAVEDHVAEGVDRLLQILRDMPRMEALLSIYLEQVNELEAAFLELYTDVLDIDVATGAQLDVLGALVGRPRAGLSDTRYRLFIRAQMIVNDSDGNTDDILRVLDLLVVDEAESVTYTEIGNATAIVEAYGLPITLAAAILNYLLQAAKAAGTRLFLWWSGPADEAFTLSSQGAVLETSSTLGLGDTGNAATGGDLAGVED